MFLEQTRKENQLGSDAPINRIRLVESGNAIGFSQRRSGSEDSAVWRWPDPMSRAILPFGAMSLRAIGSTFSKRSTARRVTNAAEDSTSSAREANTRTPVAKLSARITSRKNVTFLLFDSTSVRSRGGEKIFKGKPGKPA